MALAVSSSAPITTMWWTVYTIPALNPSGVNRATPIRMKPIPLTIWNNSSERMSFSPSAANAPTTSVIEATTRIAVIQAGSPSKTTELNR